MIRVTRKKTGHLIEITRDNGTKDVSWDWDQLLADVRAACEAYESSKPVAVVEEKKKPAAKKAAAKKAAANKPAAKKAAAKKPAKK